MTFTVRDFLRIANFVKWPALWVVTMLVGLTWSMPHFPADDAVRTVESQKWAGAACVFMFGLIGFFLGFFSVAEAIRRIDMDERLRVLMETESFAGRSSPKRMRDMEIS